MGFSWGLEFFGAGVNFFLIDKVLRPLNHMSILKYYDFFSTDYGIKYLFCLSNMMFTHYTRFFFIKLLLKNFHLTHISCYQAIADLIMKKMKIAFNDGRQALKIVNLVKVHSWKIWYILAGDMVARVSMKTLPPRDTNLP